MSTIPKPTVVSAKDVRDLRSENYRRVVSALLSEPNGLTQEALRRETELSPSTIWKIVGQLNQLEGVLNPTLAARTGRGRRATAFALNPGAAYAIGIDIGRQHVEVAMVDAFGRAARPALRSYEIASTAADRTQTLTLARRLLKRVVSSPEQCGKVAAVGIALPGPVVDGALADRAAPLWHKKKVAPVVLRQWESKKTPEVFVGNGAHFCALGELREGVGVRMDSLIFVKWSSGVEGGLVFNRSVWSGAHDLAGQLGHLKVRIDEGERSILGIPPRGDWPECPRCGRIDCVEVLAGGSAIARIARRESFERFLSDIASSPPPPELNRVLRTAARVVGRALAPVIATLDVSGVVVGGLVGRLAFESVETSLREGIHEASVAGVAEGIDIRATGLSDDATARSAALAALDYAGVDFLIGSATPRAA